LGIRGLGLGFLFIPITVAAFSGLQGKDIAQGSALFNLARQLGGSIGIAILGTYIDTMTNYHRANLLGNISNTNPLYLDRLNAMTKHFISSGLSVANSHGAALGAINGDLIRQAMTMAYNDAFLLIGITFFFAFPAIFLLKKRQPGAAPGGGAAH
jgi:DHA2 family multidrug resistance protein